MLSLSVCAGSIHQRRCGALPKRRSMPRRCCRMTCSPRPVAAKPHGAGSRRKSRPVGRVPRTTKTGMTTAFALVFDGPIDWTRFGLWLTMLLNRHGDKVLRVKGILNVADSATPVAIHGVQHLVHPPVHMAAWPDDDRSSRLVFVVDSLDRRLIERSLASFLQPRSNALSPAA